MLLGRSCIPLPLSPPPLEAFSSSDRVAYVKSLLISVSRYPFTIFLLVQHPGFGSSQNSEGDAMEDALRDVVRRQQATIELLLQTHSHKQHHSEEMPCTA